VAFVFHLPRHLFRQLTPFHAAAPRDASVATTTLPDFRHTIRCRDFAADTLFAPPRRFSHLPLIFGFSFAFRHIAITFHFAAALRHFFAASFSIRRTLAIFRQADYASRFRRMMPAAAWFRHSFADATADALYAASVMP